MGSSSSKKSELCKNIINTNEIIKESVISGVNYYDGGGIQITYNNTNISSIDSIINNIDIYNKSQKNIYNYIESIQIQFNKKFVIYVKNKDIKDIKDFKDFMDLNPLIKQFNDEKKRKNCKKLEGYASNIIEKVLQLKKPYKDALNIQYNKMFEILDTNYKDRLKNSSIITDPKITDMSIITNLDTEMSLKGLMESYGVDPEKINSFNSIYVTKNQKNIQVNIIYCTSLYSTTFDGGCAGGMGSCGGDFINTAFNFSLEKSTTKPEFIKIVKIDKGNTSSTRIKSITFHLNDNTTDKVDKNYFSTNTTGGKKSKKSNKSKKSIKKSNKSKKSIKKSNKSKKSIKKSNKSKKSIKKSKK
jgi:hypothetical protein